MYIDSKSTTISDEVDEEFDYNNIEDLVEQVMNSSKPYCVLTGARHKKRVAFYDPDAEERKTYHGPKRGVTKVINPSFIGNIRVTNYNDIDLDEEEHSSLYQHL